MRKQRAFQEDRIGRKRSRGTASGSKGMHVQESGKSSSRNLMAIYEQCQGTVDETVGWHHRLNGHEFEQTSEDGEGQGSLAGCSPWGLKESDTTERLNNNSENFLIRGQRLLFTASETGALYCSRAGFLVPAMNCRMSEGVLDLPICLRVICQFT